MVDSHSNEKRISVSERERRGKKEEEYSGCFCEKGVLDQLRRLAPLLKKAEQSVIRFQKAEDVSSAFFRYSTCNSLFIHGQS